jgi:hypothetical protein
MFPSRKGVEGRKGIRADKRNGEDKEEESKEEGKERAWSSAVVGPDKDK